MAYLENFTLPVGDYIYQGAFYHVTHSEVWQTTKFYTRKIWGDSVSSDVKAWSSLLIEGLARHYYNTH